MTQERSNLAEVRKADAAHEAHMQWLAKKLSAERQHIAWAMEMTPVHRLKDLHREYQAELSS